MDSRWLTKFGLKMKFGWLLGMGPLLGSACSGGGLIGLGGGGTEIFPGGKDSFWAYDMVVGQNNTETKSFVSVSIRNTATLGDTTFKVFDMPGNFNFDGNGSNAVKITREQLSFGPGVDDQKLPLPFAEGKSGDSYKETIGNEKISVQPKIVAKEEVTVGSNKLMAWRIEYTDTKNNKVIRKLWFSPGVGLVQARIEAPNSTVNLALTSYTIREIR